jgi:NTE family protein
MKIRTGVGASRVSNKRVAIVLSGGGARGAYEAGVLSYLFEQIYPRLSAGFEFDIVSGTSVGAIHAAYVAASAHLSGSARATPLADTWRMMALDKVLDVRLSDIAALPLKALGFAYGRRTGPQGSPPETLGGLVNVAPLERLVEERIAWRDLHRNLDAGRPGALCVACTEVDSGRVAVFLDGPLADPDPWRLDSQMNARATRITSRHVRASAAIPFLFPAVRIEERYYLDGGLRINTPLSPALRLKADHVIVVALKSKPLVQSGIPYTSPRSVTQPAFLLGKVLNALLLDQLELELRRLEVMNAMLDGAAEALGPDCLDPINRAIKAKRGVAYRKVSHVVIRPSEDIGVMAADSYHRSRSRAESRGFLANILARTALRGVPEGEADLFSYLYFDRSFTEPLLELGREDARKLDDDIMSLLA